ncbi:RNA exonuclease 4 [Cercophora newfieldiana]|uniref:RNA exonuclease 4 n=1 Tax=Cercophora newfieldiana TaxID=92897 RepID=A0AA39Y5Y8_9PEZI|nr:RNA exonuclease 4 [Cercophora newfieldiana]
MAELSSNWKKLQAKIKAESSAPKPAPKRKAADDTIQTPSQKRQKPHPKASHPQSKPPLKSFPSHKKPPSSKMGITQSSQLPRGTPSTTHPSLSLWAANHDITPESLAEAYSLGTRSTPLSLSDHPTIPNSGLLPDVAASLGKYLAIDCEMVGIGTGGHESALARVSVVDFHGKQVYDSYVRPREKVTDWRTHVSGIAPKHMATARSFEEVQGEVAGLLKDRVVVGHDVKHDLQVLELDHSARMIRDTAKFSGFKEFGNGPKPALKVLARELLGVEIQTGQHSSVEDARVAMMLFRKHKPGFDVEVANRFPEGGGGKGKAAQHKKQKKRRG